MYKLGFEETEETEIKLPFVGSSRKQGPSRKTSTSASLTMLKPLTVWITTNWKIIEMEVPDHCTCLLRNLYVGKKATVRTRHTTDWFKIGKGLYQGCILSPCLFNLYAESIMQNARLESRLPGEKSATSDVQMIPLKWQKSKRN